MGSSSDRSLLVLITNATLATRTGSETVVRDMATGLARAGHRPTVYSPRLGPIAEELRSIGIPVVNRLSEVSTTPDVIHGHHHAETVAAVLYFRDVPALFVCHHWSSWEDHPPRLSRVRRFVAVDALRRDRLLSPNWMEAADVATIPNAVDTDRFRPRETPLASAPRRALIFNNYVTATNYGPKLASICASLGLSVDVMGAGVSASCDAPEKQLTKYDLVFAVGRAAMEALACGSACILCGREGVGPLVTSQNVRSVREFNFGHVLLQERLSLQTVADQLKRYQPRDVASVQQFIRTEASLDKGIERYVSLYRDVMSDERPLLELDHDVREYTEELCREMNNLRTAIQHYQGKPYPW